MIDEAEGWIHSTAVTSRTSNVLKLRPKLKMQMNLLGNLEKVLVGSIFPENEIKLEDPHKELAFFPHITTDCQTSEEVSIAHNSLVSFLLQWGKTLEKADGSEKLPTPIFCVPFVPKQEAIISVVNSTDAESQFQGQVIKTSAVKISFRKTKRYLSRNEQRGLEKGQMPDRKGAKIDAWSPGGILLIVQTVKYDSPNEASFDSIEDMVESEEGRFMLRLELRAKRCDIDGDTVVKLSSERTIIRRLRDAIRIWNKMRTL